MRVALNRRLHTKPTGPLLFMQRLVDELIRMGVKFVDLRSGPNILLALINYRPKDIPRNTKVVLRVDGVYWNLQDKNRHLNKDIFSSVRTADGVVFQSEFCKQCVELNSGQSKLNTVIFNAVNMKEIQKIAPAKMMRRPGLLACARWRPTKRAKSICEGFLASNIPHQLYMVGKTPNKKIKHKRITWLGELSNHDSIAVMKSCTHAIHLGKFDPCPNSVIEAIGCGLPVLHTANGGTPEIVKDQGIRMPVDGDWDFKFSKSGVDDIDPMLTAKYLEDLVKMPAAVLRQELKIKYAAKQYHKFFRKVMKS